MPLIETNQRKPLEDFGLLDCQRLLKPQPPPIHRPHRNSGTEGASSYNFCTCIWNFPHWLVRCTQVWGRIFFFPPHSSHNYLWHFSRVQHRAPIATAGWWQVFSHLWPFRTSWLPMTPKMTCIRALYPWQPFVFDTSADFLFSVLTLAASTRKDSIKLYKG